jgi:hypothetical protein
MKPAPKPAIQCGIALFVCVETGVAVMAASPAGREDHHAAKKEVRLLRCHGFPFPLPAALAAGALRSLAGHASMPPQKRMGAALRRSSSALIYLTASANKDANLYQRRHIISHAPNRPVQP